MGGGNPLLDQNGPVIAYLESPALLRLVLREPGALEQLRRAEALVSSELLAVEGLRTIDRLRLQEVLSLEEAVDRRDDRPVSGGSRLVLLQRSVLSRASEPLPAPLGALDALHLATALLWREQTGKNLVTIDQRVTIVFRARVGGDPLRDRRARRRHLAHAVGAAFAEQIAALASAGADVLCVETMADLTEATRAVKAAKEVAPGVPAMAT